MGRVNMTCVLQGCTGLCPTRALAVCVQKGCGMVYPLGLHCRVSFTGLCQCVSRWVTLALFLQGSSVVAFSGTGISETFPDVIVEEKVCEMHCISNWFPERALP